MGIFNPFKKKSTDILTVADLADLTGHNASSGVAVTREAALQVSTVFACVKVLADGVAGTPLKLYQRSENGRTDLSGTDLARVLTRRPNEWQTGFEFRETMMMHAALTGDAFAFKNVVNGQLRELIPLLPNWVSIRRDSEDGSPVYSVTTPYGISDANLTSDQIFHIKRSSWDSVSGLPAIKYARNAIGLAIATEDHHGKLHANGGRPGGILTFPEALTPEKAKETAERWRRAFTGAQNAFKTAILDMGVKYQALSSSGVDNQHLETRRFQIEEICRYMKVFPQMVMSSDKTATYASAEAFFSAHVPHTLSPWLQIWAERIDEFLLDGAGPLFVEFDTADMQRASLKELADAARSLAETGVLTRNEIREMLFKRGPLAGLDTPLTPLNMQGEADEARSTPEN